MLDNLNKHFQHCQRPTTLTWVTKVDYSMPQSSPFQPWPSGHFPARTSIGRRLVSGSSGNRFKYGQFGRTLAARNLHQNVKTK